MSPAPILLLTVFVGLVLVILRISGVHCTRRLLPSGSLSLPAKSRVKRHVHLPDEMRHELINVCMIF